MIYAGSNGWVDDVPVSEVRRFESDMLDFLRANHPEVLDAIRTTGALPDEAGSRRPSRRSRTASYPWRSTERWPAARNESSDGASAPSRPPRR